MRLLHHGSGAEVLRRQVDVSRRKHLSRKSSLFSFRRHVVRQIPRPRRRNVHQVCEAFLLGQEPRLCRARRELGGRQGQVPDQKEGVSETEPLSVGRGFESPPLAFLLRPPEHGFEEADLVRVDGVLRQDDAEGAVLHVVERRLRDDVFRLRPDDLEIILKDLKF